jgi:hypothetical protein
MSEKDLRTALADYDNILGFEDVGEAVKVTMEYQRGEKGKETWGKVNAIVKEYGGEWKSQGRGSHWTVPKQQGFKQVPQPSKQVTIEQVLHDFEDVLSEFNRVLSDLSSYVFYSKEETKK